MGDELALGTGSFGAVRVAHQLGILKLLCEFLEATAVLGFGLGIEECAGGPERVSSGSDLSLVAFDHGLLAPADPLRLQALELGLIRRDETRPAK
jgi:hypothetical protein